MTIWFTADTHFDHANIMKFCPETRPGDSVDSMNENIITIWNRKIKPQDTVFHLGDFAWKERKAGEHFARLNGIKHLIIGNHDTNKVKNLPWKTVLSYNELKFHGKLIVMLHYPMLTWKNNEHGSIHLYGHVHGEAMKELEGTNSMDVGMDALDGQVLINLESVLWRFRGYEECPDCDGHGIVSDYGAFGQDFDGPKECNYCSGSGRVRKGKLS